MKHIMFTIYCLWRYINDLTLIYTVQFHVSESINFTNKRNLFRIINSVCITHLVNIILTMKLSKSEDIISH